METGTGSSDQFRVRIRPRRRRELSKDVRGLRPISKEFRAPSKEGTITFSSHNEIIEYQNKEAKKKNKVKISNTYFKITYTNCNLGNIIQ